MVIAQAKKVKKTWEKLMRAKTEREKLSNSHLPFKKQDTQSSIGLKHTIKKTK